MIEVSAPTFDFAVVTSVKGSTQRDEIIIAVVWGFRTTSYTVFVMYDELFCCTALRATPSITRDHGISFAGEVSLFTL
jgi:hypothetical protein